MKVDEIWTYKAHGCKVKITKIVEDKDEDNALLISLESLGCSVDEPGVSDGLKDLSFADYYEEEFLEQFEKDV